MGNLAHASSLESESRNGVGTRDNRSLQQIIDYNRQNRHGNSASPIYGAGSTNVNYEHRRPDSGGAGSSEVAYSRAPADNQVPAQNQYSHYATTAGYTNPTAAYRPPPHLPQNNNSYSTNQHVSHEPRQSAQYSQAPQPTNEQSHYNGGPSAQIAQGTDHSPSLHTNRAPTSKTTPYTHPTVRPEQGDRRSSASSAQISKNKNNMPAPTANTNPPVENASAHRQTSSNRSETRLPGSSEAQAPTTVDPSHVFNHQEYQRRRAAAAAEVAAKKAAEEDNRKATEAAAALKRVSESDTTRSSKEEQMAAEMRQMIEKMRDYKSKDPSLFSSIWEQVKKCQPAGTIPAAPPLSAKDIPSAASGTISPSPAPGPADGELPDLGRFPAQRRRRGTKADGPPRKRKSKSAGEAVDNSSPRVNGSQIHPPIDPAIVGASTGSQQQATPTSHQNSTTPAAHGTSATQDHQVVYVSGKGPKAKHPAAANSPRSSQPPVQVSGQIPNPAGRTNWPEHKKWDLAVAAKNVLLAMPMNSAKATSLTPEQILGYLNQNPSYEQLCQMIESTGVIIERGHFARCLLEAVPGMGVGVPRPALANKHPATHNDSKQPSGPTFGMLTSPVKLKYLSQNQKTIAHLAPTAQMTPKEGEPKVSDTPELPLTKQEKARKRNILDIVDLSQLSDDDDMMPPPPKVQRLDEYPQHNQTPVPNLEANLTHALQRTSTPQASSIPPVYQPYQSSTHHPPAYQSPFTYAPIPPPTNRSSISQSAQQRELINSEDLVQPIDDQKAKRRNRYNPKTIVRDVLIAAGRHPTMLPLNHHLDSFRKTFKHVNDMSDLDTLRWDLIDPGEPAAAALDYLQRTRDAGLQAEADRHEAETKEEKAVDPSPPQSQMMVAAGSSVQASCERPSPKNFFGESLLIRFVAIAAQPPKLRGPRRKRKTEASTPSDIDKSWMSSGLGGDMNTSVNDSFPRTPGSATNETNLSNSAGSNGIKRRGRPPGSKNKQPRRSTGILSQLANVSSLPKVDTTPARPSGLRDSVNSGDGIAVVLPSPSPSLADGQAQRRRGRPRKSSPRASQQPALIHQVYKCQWQSCPAELHNLETLQKHVSKHGDKFGEKGGPLLCLWKGCGKFPENHEPGADIEEESEQQPLQFSAQELWTKHMEERHLAKFALKLGDGPSIRVDSDMSDSVSDSAKRQMTPIIYNESRPDPLPLTSNGEPHKAYHKAHGITTELGKAQAFMDASERRRQSFGPGMDRGGATFVTKRKNSLLDDSMGPLRKVQKVTET